MNDADPRRRAGKQGQAAVKRARGGGGGGDQRERIWRVAKLVLGGLLAAGALGLFVLSGLFLYFGSDPKLPNLKRISDYKPKQQTRVLDRNGKPIGILGGGERRTVVPFADLPEALPQRGGRRRGSEVLRARGHRLRGLRPGGGGQPVQRPGDDRQLGAGGHRPSPSRWSSRCCCRREKTLRRKFQEMILARRLSQQLSKEEILTIYLNDINYGEGHYGCEEAAQYYFGKSHQGRRTWARRRSWPACPSGPSGTRPTRTPRRPRTARCTCCARWSSTATSTRPPPTSWPSSPSRCSRPRAARPGSPREAVGAVYKQLAEKYGAEAVPTLGAAVKTTIDLDLQKLAREALERGLESLDQRQGYRGPVRPPRRAEAGAVPLRAEAGPGHRPGRGRGQAGGGGRGQEQAAAALQPAPDPRRRHLRGRRRRASRRTGRRRKKGQLLVDIGGRQGTVDLSLEHRYTRGPKPLLRPVQAGRSGAGAAGPRAPQGQRPPARRRRWRWSWGRRRRWW